MRAILLILLALTSLARADATFVDGDGGVVSCTSPGIMFKDPVRYTFDVKIDAVMFHAWGCEKGTVNGKPYVVIPQVTWTGEPNPLGSKVYFSKSRGQWLTYTGATTSVEPSKPPIAGGGLLIFRISFADAPLSSLVTKESVQANGQWTADYWKAASNGAVDIGPVVVTDKLTIGPKPLTWDPASIRAQAQAAARAKGTEPNNYAWHIYIHPDAGGPLAGVYYGRQAMHLWGTPHKVKYTHETGHGLGLGHVRSATCGRTSCTVSVNQYSDPIQIMAGSNSSKIGWPATPIRLQKGWFAGEVASGLGEHTLRPYEQPNPKVVKVPSGTDGRVLWIELRDTEPGPTIFATEPSPKYGSATYALKRYLLPGSTLTDGRTTITALARDRVSIR